MGCGSANSANPPAQSTTPKGTVQIERVPEAEAVLSQLGQKSFVLKHRGGELTTDFTIYYRAEGKNQTEQVLFHASGDRTIGWLRAWPNNDGRHREEGGYAIIAWPEHFGQTNGNLTFSFSLNGARTSTSPPEKEIYAKTLLSGVPVIIGSSQFPSPVLEIHGSEFLSAKLVELRPGETATLVEYSQTISTKPPDSNKPLKQGTVRYFLSATALKDGQLPKRDKPSTE